MPANLRKDKPVSDFMEALREGSKWAVLTAIGIAAAIIIGLLLMTMAVWGYGFYSDATSDRAGKTDKQRLIERNGSYRIAAYDHFYDLCAAVQTTEDGRANLACLSARPFTKEAMKEFKVAEAYLIGLKHMLTVSIPCASLTE